MDKTDEQIRLAYRVLDHIEANPGRHDQEFWIYRGNHYRGEGRDMRTHTMQSVMECGTTACAAGWTVLLSDMSITGANWVPESGNLSVSAAATDLLGLSWEEADELFWEANDLADVRKQVFEIFGPRPDGAL